MKAYKGFDKDLKCRDKQYEIGEEYHEPEAALCNCGFHACENPLDCFRYYAPATSRYAEVELGEVSAETAEDSKRVGKAIKIVRELTLVEMMQAASEYIAADTSAAANTGNQSAATNTGDRSAATNTGYQSAATNTGNQSAATNTGYWSAATNTGNQSAATNTGYQSAATNTGNRSAATNTGYQSAATNTGYWSAATNTGYQSAATNTGYQSAATNTGDRSAATNTGYQSAATNTGYWSAATVEGADSIAIATGYESKAKGATGCYVVLTERDFNGHILAVKSHKVDGKTIKADTFYTLKDGKFVEVE